TTDSTGRFAFPDVPAGAYLLLVRHRTHWPQRRSVALPPGEERELSVLLVPLGAGLASGRAQRLSGYGPREEAATLEFTSRRLRCRTSRTGPGILVPREEIANSRAVTLRDALALAPTAVSAGYGGSQIEGYSLFVDGQAFPNWGLTSLTAADVEAVEIYPANPFARVPLRGSTFGFASPDRFLSFEDLCPAGSLWVWTQR
ncbi:MAG: hypothetical protein ACREN5_08930, partial [Gemmatimonadales bacterium]